jgi:FAD/FMN-containing dehydrogenase
MTSASPPGLGAATVQELREDVRGDVLDPADLGYVRARAVWNGDVDRHPSLVVRPAGAADVITALRFARSEGLEVAVRGGGHNVAGFGTTDGGLVIDLCHMKGVRVDPHANRARAQGGALWGDVDHETQAFGLATTGGLVSTTGIGGFTLGGGIGWLMRRHGLTIDNLLGADVITAEGKMVHADAQENTDLFWGLRGGGGNFGIVTEFEYALHEVGPLVYGGPVFHKAERAGELLAFYADWVKTLPDELTTMVVFITAPPEPFVPAALVGRPLVGVVSCHIGDHDDAERTIRPLRAFAQADIDLAGPIPYVALQSMFDKAAPRGIRTYWKTAYLDDLSRPVIDTLVEAGARLSALNPHSAVHLHHLGGAVSRVDGHSTAFPHRNRPFVFNAIGMWDATNPREAHVTWVRETWDALQSVGAGEPYLNFLSDDQSSDVHAAYGRHTHQRLVELKDRYDPANVFHVNQNVRPSGS